MKILLKTGRLVLRELVLPDAPFIIELLNSPGWLQYIGDRHVRTTEEAHHYLRAGPLKSYKEHGFGLYLVETKAERKPVGMCGLLQRDYLPYPDLGFAFLPLYQGKGYGYEAARHLLIHASKIWQMHTIGAITLPNNMASGGLLTKLGFSYKRPVESPQGETLSLYETYLCSSQPSST